MSKTDRKLYVVTDPEVKKKEAEEEAQQEKNLGFLTRLFGKKKKVDVETEAANAENYRLWGENIEFAAEIHKKDTINLELKTRLIEAEKRTTSLVKVTQSLEHTRAIQEGKIEEFELELGLLRFDHKAASEDIDNLEELISSRGEVIKKYFQQGEAINSFIEGASYFLEIDDKKIEKGEFKTEYLDKLAFCLDKGEDYQRKIMSLAQELTVNKPHSARLIYNQILGSEKLSEAKSGTALFGYLNSLIETKADVSEIKDVLEAFLSADPSLTKEHEGIENTIKKIHAVMPKDPLVNYLVAVYELKMNVISGKKDELTYFPDTESRDIFVSTASYFLKTNDKMFKGKAYDSKRIETIAELMKGDLKFASKSLILGTTILINREKPYAARLLYGQILNTDGITAKTEAFARAGYLTSALVLNKDNSISAEQHIKSFIKKQNIDIN